MSASGTSPQDARGGGLAAPRLVELDALVPGEFNGKRFDWAVARLVAGAAEAPTLSRSELKRWIEAGWIRLNGGPAKPKTLLRGGERIQVRANREPRFDWQAAEPLAFPVVHADDAVIVVDKPAGLVVHPGAGNPGGTLVNGMLHRWPKLAELPRAGLVHRLDKDTSGLMLVAASPDSQLALVAAMSERRIERRYLALLEGQVLADQRVELPIGRDRRNRLRQAVREDGRDAATDLRILKRYPAHTLVEARLQTGRMHQIRVHCAAIGHPLVGDKRYGARGVVPAQMTATDAACVQGFGRQALHAFHLAFEHPQTGAPLRFESKPPADFQRLLQALG